MHAWAARAGGQANSTSKCGYLILHHIITGKAAAFVLSLRILPPPPGHHDPVRVSYPWAPMHRELLPQSLTLPDELSLPDPSGSVWTAR